MASFGRLGGINQGLATNPCGYPVQRRALTLGGMVQIRTTVGAKVSVYSQWQADLTKMHYQQSSA
jgi:hypothetical protein